MIATRAFADAAAALPELAVPLIRAADDWDELRYRESVDPGTGACIGWLEFDFHHGAMSTRQSERLRDAIGFAAGRRTQLLVLAGGAGFFSNGIHLHDIEAAADDPDDSAADASWRNSVAIDDVARAILQFTDRWVVAALRGNAGAGGYFLALAADEVWAHGGVVLNPRYNGGFIGWQVEDRLGLTTPASFSDVSVTGTKPPLAWAAVTHAQPPEGGPAAVGALRRQHSERLRRNARLDIVRGHHLGSLACKPLAGSPVRRRGRRTAPCSTTNATALR